MGAPGLAREVGTTASGEVVDGMRGQNRMFTTERTEMIESKHKIMGRLGIWGIEWLRSRKDGRAVGSGKRNSF